MAGIDGEEDVFEGISAMPERQTLFLDLFVMQIGERAGKICTTAQFSLEDRITVCTSRVAANQHEPVPRYPIPRVCT